MVKADGTIFLIAGGATVFVVGDDKRKVLIGVGGTGVDAQIELGNPFRSLRNDIVFET